LRPTRTGLRRTRPTPHPGHVPRLIRADNSFVHQNHRHWLDHRASNTPTSRTVFLGCASRAPPTWAGRSGPITYTTQNLASLDGTDFWCRRGDLNAPGQVLWCHLTIVSGRYDISMSVLNYLGGLSAAPQYPRTTKCLFELDICCRAAEI